jgi:hypothetical protein
VPKSSLQNLGRRAPLSLRGHGFREHSEHVGGMENDGRTRPGFAVQAKRRPYNSFRSLVIMHDQNHDTGEGKTQSFLLESNYQHGRDTVYGRWERVEKSGHELVLNPPDESRVFPVSGYTIGYVRDLSHGNGIDIGLGTQFTINDRPDRLDRYYGDDLGYGFQCFLRIRPSLHSHGGHEHAEHVAGMEK